MSRKQPLGGVFPVDLHGDIWISFLSIPWSSTKLTRNIKNFKPANFEDDKKILWELSC